MEIQPTLPFKRCLTVYQGTPLESMQAAVATGIHGVHSNLSFSTPLNPNANTGSSVTAALLKPRAH